MTESQTQLHLFIFEWLPRLLLLPGRRPPSPQCLIGMHLFRLCGASPFIQLLALSRCLQVVFAFDFSSTIVTCGPQFGNYTSYIILSIIWSFLCRCVSFPQCTGPWSGRQAGSVLYNLAALQLQRTDKAVGGSFYFPPLPPPPPGSYISNYISRAA